MASKIKLNTSERDRVSITLKQQKEIRRLYGRAYRNIRKEVNKVSKKSTVSATIREQELKKLRTKIGREYASMRKQIQRLVEKGMLDVAQTIVNDTDKWLKSVGLTIEGAYSYVPEEVVESIVTGKVYEGKWSLSRALWSDVQKKQKDINFVIAQGIAENKSTYEIAKDLERYVNPSARKAWEWKKVYPGTNTKIDYNAQRLARTLVTHSYQQSIIRTARDNPFVIGIKWLTSGGHSRTCEICRERETQDKYGLGVGVFPPDKLPLDHPNGLCTFAVITDNLSDVSDRLANWVNGKQDKTLDTFVKNIKK